MLERRGEAGVQAEPAPEGLEPRAGGGHRAFNATFDSLRISLPCVGKDVLCLVGLDGKGLWGVFPVYFFSVETLAMKGIISHSGARMLNAIPGAIR